ncbi:YhcB family protein [Glaesserella parasuis]|uniref:YhcB family protein n=1 Tax=Glaesserella parasuis TaxID=738 RepID=UPI00136571EA|nr:YhcB family protein [Glaesserella parasuis]MDG6264708.1 YhcB family protein [Glaesserella parasuis]MDG6266762.1 YhcB family protein [Glaesserella parasuis]MDP0231581.1 YhcB family protein [Glaesserella parasuis]MDP0265307.1 YhcB family protein [Glaesserella parasuis]MWQ72022.1 YhcB family protein [Glaesserella parasuis]
MEQWSGNVWTAIIAAFIVGCIISYVVVRATNSNVKKQLKLEANLKETTKKLDEQKQQLEQHFEQSATLLATLAEDYKKLYTHLAKGSESLLPSDSAKIEFFQQPKIENKPQTDEDQPKDYSEGSSGLLKS